MALTKVTGAGVEGVTISSTTDVSDQFILTNTDTGSSSGPDLVLFRQSTSSAADSDGLGRMDFRGLNDANEEINYFTISARIDDNTDGTENGMLRLQHIKDGSYVEPVVIDGSGNILVGQDSTTTPVSGNTVGTALQAGGRLELTCDGNTPIRLNRKSDDGAIAQFRKDGSVVGSIGTDNSGDIYIGNDDTGFLFAGGSNAILPWDPSGPSSRDNAIDLGVSSHRFDDIYATNSSIQTSDENEKQDIASFTTKELAVATKLSALFKTFKWKDKVTEKADKARTHSGIVAQQVKTTFASEGLDATNYGLFISTTWTDDNGKEQTRMGIRYPELFSFIFGSIEARLTALEAK